jgi:SAM-dependent methyltransferase
MAKAKVPHISHDALRAQSRTYYEQRLRDHGVTPRGVDWNSQESQELRFHQLERLLEGHPDATVLDYGCGFGAMALYLRQRGHLGAYVGFDVSPDMIEAARRVTASVRGCRFTSDRTSLSPVDFVVSSGVFNVRGDAPDDAWRGYVGESLDDMRALCTAGFAFNLLTANSDRERRREDLYYADPLDLFEHCRTRFSRHVALLHDYGLYEFTILVRMSL